MYKTIVVHVGADARRRERLEVACGLASGFDAHLVGLFALTELGVPFVLGGNAGAVIEAETRWRGEAAEAARRDFESATKRAGVAKNEWRRSDRGAGADGQRRRTPAPRIYCPTDRSVEGSLSGTVFSPGAGERHAARPRQWTARPAGLGLQRQIPL